MPQRIAIVTGAARGIGAGTAKRLASDGLAVAVLDLSEANGADTVAEIEKAGGKAIAVGADVSDADQVQEAVDKVVADLKSVEVPSKVKDLHNQLVAEISDYGTEIDKAKAAFSGNDPQAIIKAQVDLQSAVTRVSGQINRTIDAINKKLRE